MNAPLRLGIYGMPVDRAGLDYVIEAERLGVDSVGAPEFWGYDALTPLGAVAAVTDRIRIGTAIVQLGSRTPAMLAMSAMTLQQLSGGRFLLGLGASGPQVMEGSGHRGRAADLRRRRVPTAASRQRGQGVACGGATGARTGLRGVARPRQSATHGRRRRWVDRQLVLL